MEKYAMLRDALSAHVRLIAFITRRANSRHILDHMGLDAQPRRALFFVGDTHACQPGFNGGLC